MTAFRFSSYHNRVKSTSSKSISKTRGRGFSDKEAERFRFMFLDSSAAVFILEVKRKINRQHQTDPLSEFTSLQLLCSQEKRVKMIDVYFIRRSSLENNQNPDSWLVRINQDWLGLILTTKVMRIHPLRTIHGPFMVLRGWFLVTMVILWHLL